MDNSFVLYIFHADMALKSGVHNLFQLKGQLVNILGFVSPIVSVTTT